MQQCSLYCCLSMQSASEWPKSRCPGIHCGIVCIKDSYVLSMYMAFICFHSLRFLWIPTVCGSSRIGCTIAIAPRYMTNHGIQMEHFLFAKWGWSMANNHVWWHMMRPGRSWASRWTTGCRAFEKAAQTDVFGVSSFAPSSAVSQRLASVIYV